jgi:copper chaperone NosL
MKNLFNILGIIFLGVVFSCSPKGPEKINFGKDQCELCKMGIEDPKFATELITEKGRIYKFDDLNCMQSYATENAEQVGQAKLYVPDFLTNELFPLEKATLITGGAIKSPMNGNVAAFIDKTKAQEEAQKLGASFLEQ